MKRTRKKKKPKGNPANLNAGQVQFIYNKVRLLGSVEAVERFYNKGDAVGQFARLTALNMFKGEFNRKREG